MRRRLKFTTVVLISQMLLIALAIAWLVHMIVIAAYGAVYFIQRDPLVLWIEISASLIITLFAVFVLIFLSPFAFVSLFSTDAIFTTQSLCQKAGIAVQSAGPS